MEVGCLDSFSLDSSIRQSCSLSPVLFAIVVDLFNKAIINNGEFKEHAINDVTKKISVYADDIAVHKLWKTR